jgi:hypothetical protein
MPVRPDQWMVQTKLAKKLVNDDSLINDIDPKSIYRQNGAVVFQPVWISD